MTQLGKGTSGRSREWEEIVGIVHPLGAGGGRAGRESLWTLRFSFSAWRRGDGRIEERQLSLFMPSLTDAELREMMESVKPYDIIRVRVRFSGVWGGADVPQGELAGVLGEESSDNELNARVERLRQPVTVDHPFFGTLTLDRALNCYDVAFPWNSRPVQLSLSLDGCEDEHELFGTAESLWGQQKEWEDRVREYAAGQLLGLKNDSWLGEDEIEFTPARFKAQMSLQAIVVYPGGAFEFTYDDGDLFCGHVVKQ